MLISVIVPVYNSEKTITATLDSILNQTYTNIEIIVVNDGSTDASKKIIESYDDYRIKIINKENGGVSSARNVGIKSAHGEYVAFCDSDDIWKPNKLERQIYYINLYKDVDFIGCNRNGESVRVLLKSYNKVKKIKFYDMLLKMFPQTSTVIIKKSVFSDIGLYDENQKYAEDGNLWLRICKKKNCYMMPDDLVVTGDGKPSFGYSGLSANLKAMNAGVIKNINEMYYLQYITIVGRFLLIIFEKVKYLRRILICKLRRS